MTKEEFVTNNLRIGDDLSPEFLEVIHENNYIRLFIYYCCCFGFIVDV